ncbi:XRE family transcriptional regulator [Enterocloster bolteae]|uniref:XRE family transcriptional regulator n=2 Tax=Enterocloster TaxID=2719313 RepID=A0A414AHR9_9FIRM|nr:XRE family transcriptional regulator [Enterocloster bolteae]
MPSSFFSEWKRGKMMPKADKLQILADYFGVPLDYFLKE